MKKYYKLLIIIGALLILYFAFFSNSNVTKDDLDIEKISDQTNTENNNLSKYVLNITAEGHDPITYLYSESDDLTAYGLLEKATFSESFEIEVEEYDFGVFVKTINGLESSAEMAWIYFVNGESAQVAADQYSLNPGDVVEWKYLAPTEN
jgi:hypothetical protein